MSHLASIGKALAALAVGAIGFAGAAMAQNYPTRPITLVYPYPAGSTTEVAWRVLAQEASKLIGQPIVVENKVGAGGRLGAEAVLGAKPDGYTVGMFNNAIAVVQPLQDKALAITPGKEYLPVLNGFETGLILAGKPDLPYKDIPGLIAYAKANPGKVSIGSSGAGTGGHLSIVLLEHLAGIKVNHVPYKGNAPQVTGLLSGEVDAIVTDAAALPHIQAGKMIAIGTTTAKRWSLFPDVKTIAEQGVAGYASSSYQGLVVPPGTPPEVVAKLADVFNRALKAPEPAEKMKATGLDVIGGTADDFAKLINSDLVKWKPVVEAIPPG